MKLGDRSVCGESRLNSDGRVDPALTPLVVERLVDDRRSASPRLARTLVAGLLAPPVRAVTVLAHGRAQPVSFDPRTRTRTFLAVLPGLVRRADLRLSFRLAHGRQDVDFGSGRTGRFGGDEPLVVGSQRTAISIKDPRVRFPLALVVYRIHSDGAKGSETEPCAEPGEVIDGQPGAYNPTWGDFLYAPTLVELPELTRMFAPTTNPAPSISSCLTGIDDFTGGPVGGLGVRRLGPGLVLVHGFVAPGVRRLKVLPPHGGAFETEIDAASRAFLALVPSRGGRGERARLLAIGWSSHRRATAVALGDQEKPTSFQYRLRNRRRTIHVVWTGGFEPFVGADVSGSHRRLTIRVLQLFPPDFAPDGTTYGSPDIGISKCADIQLRAPLPQHAVIVDGATGHPASSTPAQPSPRGVRCTRVRPGQRVEVRAR